MWEDDFRYMLDHPSRNMLYLTIVRVTHTCIEHKSLSMLDLNHNPMASYNGMIRELLVDRKEWESCVR